MCDAALDLEMNQVLTAFGVTGIKEIADEFTTVSLDSL
jgi:hypothetical protein